MTINKNATREEWLEARRALLAEEKAFTRQKDALNAKRRALPWVKMEKDYQFDTERGRETLRDLFGDCAQLIIYHFMYGPDWKQGCKSCSFWAESFNGNDAHFNARNISFKVVSRAALPTLLAYRQRMNWQFDWVSSAPSDFNFDFHVSFESEQQAKQYNFQPFEGNADELPGISAFMREGDDIYHTYSAYGRGLDLMNAAYNYIDLTAKGRDEDALDYPMAWLKHKDLY
jgi:predicted dithiol-disulfide oxidoreductase (DUF899 family)